MSLRNFYQPLTPLFVESNIVESPIVLGKLSYAGVLRKEKNNTVLGGSMISAIKGRDLMMILKKTFRGATSKDMLNYTQTLDWQNLDSILIHVGTSDATLKRKTPTNTNEVIISSIVRRKSFKFQIKIIEVNSVLKDLFVINGFRFIVNANSNNSGIRDDLLHLKYSGTCKLANNFINVIYIRC